MINLVFGINLSFSVTIGVEDVDGQNDFHGSEIKMAVLEDIACRLREPGVWMDSIDHFELIAVEREG